MFDTPGLKTEVITTIQILKQSDANEVCDFFFWAIPISYRGTHLRLVSWIHRTGEV